MHCNIDPYENYILFRRDFVGARVFGERIVVHRHNWSEIAVCDPISAA